MAAGDTERQDRNCGDQAERERTGGDGAHGHGGHHHQRLRAEAVDEFGGECFDFAIVLDLSEPPIERQPHRQRRGDP